MEDSTQALLVILITVLSTLTIIALALVIVVAVYIKKLVKKAEMTVDTASETVSVIRNRLIKRAGLFATARYLTKAIRGKKS